MKRLFALALLLSSFQAFSNSYIVCAQKADFDEYIDSGKVVGFELALSSEDDNYNGVLGSKRYMKLGSEDSEWLASIDAIVASTHERGEDVVVNIALKHDLSTSGPVGIKYKLIGLFDDTPVLEKYAMGGLAGSVKLATFECIGSYD